MDIKNINEKKYQVIYLFLWRSEISTFTQMRRKDKETANVMDKISLIRPSRDLESQAIEYKREHFLHGETVIHGSELWDKMESYDEWLEMATKNSCKETVSQDWVVADTFFAVRECNKKIIGMIDFRHELSGVLKDYGHSGYSVRPSERKKGYATEMLRQILEIAKRAGLKEFQLACKRNNIPSVKTIAKNGGVYVRSFQFGNEAADVFIIKLAES
jgi:predicted acetyltransferase